MIPDLRHSYLQESGKDGGLTSTFPCEVEATRSERLIQSLTHMSHFLQQEELSPLERTQS